MWTTLFVQPILNLLMLFYWVLFSNLGLAILGLTVFIRVLLFPLTLPALKMAGKQRELKPELDRLKAAHKGDKERLAKEQMALLSKHGVNPASGCLPQIVQLVIMIALYQVFIKVLSANGQSLDVLNQLLYVDFLKIAPEALIKTQFLYLDLTSPDPYYILPILAGVAQWFVIRMGRPQESLEEKSKDDTMGSVQSQMGILFPLMTVFVGVRLQSGLVLYWLVSTLLSLVQQKWVAERSNIGVVNPKLKT